MTTLESLGWRNHFAMQLEPDSPLVPARVMAVHRGRVEVVGEDLDLSVELSGNAAGLGLTVGDWVLIDIGGPRVAKLLERFCLFKRGSPGSAGSLQLIAANVDTLFVVTSANRDFNVARLERYLAIAREAGAYPVVVITKADQAESVDNYVVDALRLAPGLQVEALDARSPGEVRRLADWCGPGQTVALLGSSGVGKSTLVNTLTGAAQQTHGVREDDQRGRHTTTGRSMHRLAGGGWLIDTPGMRELQLVDLGDALDDVFADVTVIAENCRFADCEHEGEPGCAVLVAINDGRLDGERLRRFKKLRSEERRNTETLAERRARDRRTGQLYKSILAGKQRQKGER